MADADYIDYYDETPAVLEDDDIYRRWANQVVAYSQKLAPEQMPEADTREAYQRAIRAHKRQVVDYGHKVVNDMQCEKTVPHWMVRVAAYEIATDSWCAVYNLMKEGLLDEE